MAVTIYHNPRCSKSRKTLELLKEAGAAHTVVLYREDTPNPDRLLEIARMLGRPLADLLRRGESVFKEASDLPDLDDDEALARWIAANPIVLERPIVVDDERGKAVIGRPPENVSALLS